MLKIDWYLDSPIDFEHKNYLLLDYLSKIDSSYSNHQLSPYLLWTEKMVNELTKFQLLITEMESNFRKELIGISYNKLIYSQLERDNLVDEIYQIVDYSIPILESKVKLGYKLFQKYPQILY
jgi:hypothetical protein